MILSWGNVKFWNRHRGTAPQIQSHLRILNLTRCLHCRIHHLFLCWTGHESLTCENANGIQRSGSFCSDELPRSLPVMLRRSKSKLLSQTCRSEFGAFWTSWCLRRSSLYTQRQICLWCSSKSAGSSWRQLNSWSIWPRSLCRPTHTLSAERKCLSLRSKRRHYKKWCTFRTYYAS